MDVWNLFGSTFLLCLLLICSSESGGDYAATPHAFIFSLHNKEGLEPFKAMVADQYRAIFRHASYGITFGSGNDLYVGDESQQSYSRFGSSYSVPAGVQDRLTILAGTSNFTPDEVEVFYLDV